MKPLITIALTTAIITSPATAVAAPKPYQLGDLNSSLPTLFNLRVVEQPTPGVVIAQPEPEPEKPEKKEKPKPVVYTVKSGDNLTKIGTEHNVKWQRLWAKNKKLKHPDLIYPGDKITIPLPSEKLKRAIPAAVSLPVETPGVATPTQPVPANYDGGNTYDYGYCTWYVKNRRGASLPNGLGNANTWYARARGMGLAVGPTPRAGAVGTTTRGALGHVVYVESVNKDGSITISEMNAAAGWGNVNTRKASASEFLYIY